MNWTRGLCGGGGLLFHSFQARYSRTSPIHSPRRTPTSPAPPVLSPAAVEKRYVPDDDAEPDGKGLLANPNHCRGRGPGLLPPAPDVYLRSNYGLPLHPSASAQGSQSGELHRQYSIPM